MKSETPESRPWRLGLIVLAMLGPGCSAAHGLDERSLAIVGCAFVGFEGALAGISAVGYSDYGAHGMATVHGTVAALATGVTFGLSLDRHEGVVQTAGRSLARAVVVSAPLWGLTLMNHQLRLDGAHRERVLWSNFIGLNLTAVYLLLASDRWPLKRDSTRRISGSGR